MGIYKWIEYISVNFYGFYAVIIQRMKMLRNWFKNS